MGNKFKREAASMKYMSALAAAQPEEIRTRRTAAEETYSGVLNRLGAKGTYEQVGGAESLSSLTGAGGAAGPDSPQDAGIFKTTKAKSAAATDIDKRYMGEGAIQDITSLDSKKTVDNVEKSAQFRIMSRLTAESEQLLAREGALYDEMEKNLQNPIIEGSASIARENAAEIKRAMARGGSARRGAMQAVEKIRSQERINQQKVTAINESRFKLDEWARENARENLRFGQSWASNLGGVRESFNQAMDKASELMLTSALPIMVSTTQQAHAYRRQAHAASQSGVARWGKAILGGLMMAYGGGGGGGSLIEGALSPSGEGGGGGGNILAGNTGGAKGPGFGGQQASSSPYQNLKSGFGNLIGDVKSLGKDIGSLGGLFR